MPRQSGGAAPATFVGGLTMSERVVGEGQSWASDIIGVLCGVGLYSVLIFLVTFLCLYVRLEAGDRLRLGGLCSTCDRAR